MKTFQPTQDQIRLAEAVLVATAHETLIRPIVESYRKEILAKHQFRISSEWVAEGEPDEVILDITDDYLMSDEDSKIYIAECNSAREAAKLSVDDPRFCPLLVAEHLRIKAEHALLEAISTIPGLESFATAHWKLDERKEAVRLSLGLLKPYCGNAKTILDQYTVSPKTHAAHA